MLKPGSVQKHDGEVETLGPRQQGSLRNGEEDIEAPEAWDLVEGGSVVVQHEASGKVERRDIAEETAAREGTALVEATALAEGAALVEPTGPLEQTALLLRRWLASQEAWLDLPSELVCVCLLVSGNVYLEVVETCFRALPTGKAFSADRFSSFALEACRK